MNEIAEILIGFSKRVGETKNLGEAASYIINTEDLAKFMSSLEETRKIQNVSEEESHMHSVLASLVVGYHLGINKQKEAN